MSELNASNAETIIALLKIETESAFSSLELWFAKTGSLRAYHAQGEEWCINQILEHVSLVNHYLLLLIDKGARKALRRHAKAPLTEMPPGYELTSTALEEIGINNSFEWRCPDHMVPAGSIAIEKTRERLREQRAKIADTIDLVKKGEGVLSKTYMSVHSLGKLDVYQYIYFLLKHVRRHVQQMEGIEGEYNTR